MYIYITSIPPAAPSVCPIMDLVDINTHTYTYVSTYIFAYLYIDHLDSSRGAQCVPHHGFGRRDHQTLGVVAKDLLDGHRLELVVVGGGST